MQEIRDPVYGDVPLTDTEVKVLDTREFQRLRGLRQLPTVGYVFPAEHTRFWQSIGTLEVVRKITSSINTSKGRHLTQDEVTYLRLAALLADIEDPPFYQLFYEDHANEKLIKTIRTEIRRGRIKDIFDVVNNQSHEKIDFERVLSIFEADSNDPDYFLRQIINSEVGADRLDYLHRDSVECHVPYGIVDERIFNQFSVEGNQLLLEKDAVPLVDSLFHSLFQMKYAVYDHKVSRAVITMLRGPYKRALQKRKGDRLRKLMKADDAEFLRIMRKIRIADGENPVERIMARKLIKMVYTLGAPYLKHISLVKALEGLRPNIDEIEKELRDNFDRKFYVDLVPPRPAPAEPIRAKVNSEPEGLPLSESPLLKDWYGINVEKQWKMFVFCDPHDEPDRKLLERQLDDVFGCFGLGPAYEPKQSLNSLSATYPVLRVIGKRAAAASLIPELLKLKSHERATLVGLVGLRKPASAAEVADATKRSRTVESLYLNQLTEKYVTKERQGKRILFRPSEEVRFLVEDGRIPGED